MERATYKVNELARVLGVSRGQVYLGLHDGRIPHIRFGKRFVIPRSAVDEWMKNVGKPKPVAVWPEVGGYRV